MSLARAAAMGEQTADAHLERLVLEFLRHPRYGGGYVSVWRIHDALAAPKSPAAIRWTLQRLEAHGKVERRRAAPRMLEWRATGA